MKFYYNKQGRLEQIKICCLKMIRHSLSHRFVIETMYSSIMNSTPIKIRDTDYIFFCPFCGRSIKRYSHDEKSTQSRVESLMNLPSDTTDVIPPLPSERSDVRAGSVGAVNSGYDSLEKIEHELEIEHGKEDPNS